MKRNLLYFILGLVLSLAGLVHLFYFDRHNSERYQNIVQKRIDKAIKTIESEQIAITKLIQSEAHVRFSEFQIKNYNPYFVFKDDSLIFWSDYKYVIEREQLKETEESYLIEDDQNIYLVKNKKTSHLGSNYIISSVIRLYEYTDFGEGLFHSNYNPQIFLALTNKVYSENPGSESVMIRGSSGEELFWFEPLKKSKSLSKIESATTVILYGLGVGLLLFFFIKKFRKSKSEKNHFLVGFYFSVIILLITSLLKVFYLPWRFIPSGILPAYLVGSDALGDRIIFLFSGIIILLGVSVWVKNVSPESVRRNIKGSWGSILSVILVVSAIFVGLRCSYLILKLGSSSLYISPYSIRYYMVIFNMPVYLYFIFLFSVFFLAFHFNSYYFLALNTNIRSGIAHWLYATTLSLILAYFLEYDMIIVIGGSVFFFLIYYFNLSVSYYSLGLKIYSYLILGAVLYTLILFRSTAKIEYDQKQQDLIRIANNLKQQRDFKGEILLSQFNNILSGSPELKKAFEQEVFPYESIRYIVRDSLLNDYFDNYELSIYAYDPQGRPLERSPEYELSDIYSDLIYSGQKTECRFLTLNQLNDGSNIYTLVNEVSNDQGLLGTVVLNIIYDLSKLKSYSIDYTTLIQERMPDLNKYSFVIFDSHENILFRRGEFIYGSDFVEKIVDKQLPVYFNFQKNFHYQTNDERGNTIVVSTPVYYFKNLISKLSNLYLLSIFGVFVLFLMLILLRGFKGVKLTFSSRIRAYTNIAFLVPLTVIVLITSAVVTESLKANQDEALGINSANIANTIDLIYQNYQSGQISQGVLFENINNNFNHAEVEVNLFNLDGSLLFTTRPGYYEYDQLAPYINPQVISLMETEDVEKLVLGEEIAHLDFKTIYYKAKGLNNVGYGYLGISFPKSSLILERQTKEIITAILNTFFVLFIILTFASFIVGNRLTRPLSLIAEKLNKTRLLGVNEKMDWQEGGEIGVLATEYNKMIEQLERSKQELYSSQKQTAWKEMAKQVAHEIKNPLTPMKLSIQQLQRTLKEDNKDNKEKVNKVLSSINEQIDTISEIANSFSEFAKMPAPTTEPFELVEVVQKAVNLYAQNSKMDIAFDSDSDEIWVLGDKMVLNRAVTNLILNGIQSVPDDIQPSIKVFVFENEHKGRIEVSDNGVGISEETKKKIFVPNFTTKVTGSGLGLAMSKRGIEHSGGDIWFESEYGKGSTFFIDLLKTEKPDLTEI